jgi:hypothetical protein
MLRKTNNAENPFQKLQAQVEAQAREIGVEIEFEEFSKEWYAADWINRKKIFIEREIKVRDAFHKNKLVPFILNAAQLVLLESSNEASLDESLENFTLKCRRLGISTYYCADYLADAVIEDGHHVRLVAQDPKTVGALMKVIKTMYENLRPEIKPVSKYNSKYELEFENGSRVSISCVVPGHEEQGRGDTITRLHLTEIPFWNGDAETAATALCDAAKGGKISGESTAKGVGDWFHQKYTQGKNREGGIVNHFFEWWWNENYQIEGARFEFFEDELYLLFEKKHQGLTIDELSLEDRQTAKVSTYDDKYRRENNLLMQSEVSCAQKIAGHLERIGEIPVADCLDAAVASRLAWRRNEIAKKKERKFRVEYPENDIDPFTQTGGSVFDQSYTVVEVQPREPEAGHDYLVINDPSIGIEGSGDPAVVTVIDRLTGDQVFSWRGWEKQDLQAKRCCDLSDKYFGADIVVESNMGEAVIIEIENLGYGHRLYKYIDVQTQRDVDDGKISMMLAMERARPGLPMTEKIKRTAITRFEKAWREGEFRACSENLCGEAIVFVQNGNKMGAKSGFHDDEIMACAIGWFVIENDYIGKASYKSGGQKLGSAKMGGF